MFCLFDMKKVLKEKKKKKRPFVEAFFVEK